MTHVGEELRLGARRLLGRLLGVREVLRALFDQHLQLARAALQLLLAQPEHQESEQQHGTGADGLEPGRLVEVRQQLEGLRSADLVPQAVVIAGDHAEHIFAGRQSRVVRGATRVRFDPVGLVAFELVAEVHALRRQHAERGVVKLPARAARRRA